MPTLDKLSESLVFREDGHLTDLGISVFADAEWSMLPSEATQHVEHCETCAHRAGDLALASHALRENVRTAVAQERAAAARFPRMAVLAAAIVSVLFALPLFSDLVAGASNAGTKLAKSAPLALRGASESMALSGMMLVVSSLVLLALCAWMARRLLSPQTARS